MDIDAIINNINTLKDTEEKNKKLTNTTSDPRILRFKKGCKYVGLFVPTAKDTLLAYEEVGFPSRAVGSEGQYVALGRSYSDPLLKHRGENIVSKTQWDEYKKAKASNDEAAMKDTYKLIPQRKQMVNFLLLAVEGDDQVAKESVGQVKVVRYPASLDKEKKPKSAIYKTIDDGLIGSGQKKIGKKGFIYPDTVKDNVKFIFDVQDKGGYPNYDQSKFDLLGAYDEALALDYSKEQVLEILKSAHDLNDLLPELKPQAELKELLEQHWFGNSASAEDEVMTESDIADDDDEIPGLGASTSSSKTLDEDLEDLLK